MKVRIITTVWQGEFDESEFPAGARLEYVSDGSLRVIQEFEFDPTVEVEVELASGARLRIEEE